MKPPRSLPIPCPRRLILLAAAGLGSCGGSTDPPPARPTPAADRPPSCAERGIDATGGREGTCTVGPVTRTVVNRDRRLVFAGDMAVRLGRVRVTGSGRRRLVVISLHVRNLRDGPLRWPTVPGTLALFVGDRLLPQTRAGRAAAGRHAPGGRSGGPIPPQGSRTVVGGWRLSAATAGALEARGSAVIVVPPSETDVGFVRVEEALRIGVLRLWK